MDKGVVVDLGRRISALRGDRSQREIARAAQLDVSTVSRIERGALDPTFTTLSRLAASLGVSVWEVAGDLRPGPRAPVALASDDDTAAAPPNEEPVSLDQRRAQKAERREPAMTLADLPLFLAEMNDDLAEAQAQIADLQAERTERENAPQLPALLEQLVPLLEAFVNGRGDANTLQVRVEALRALARLDHRGSAARA